jgi:hypothetical protein
MIQQQLPQGLPLKAEISFVLVFIKRASVDLQAKLSLPLC